MMTGSNFIKVFLSWLWKGQTRLQDSWKISSVVNEFQNSLTMSSDAVVETGKITVYAGTSAFVCLTLATTKLTVSCKLSLSKNNL